MIDGTYNCGTLSIPAFPNPQLLTIQGNPSNPTAVNLVAPSSCTSADNAFVSVLYSQGLTIRYFLISATSTSCTYGLSTGYGARLTIQNIQIQGFTYPVITQTDSSLYVLGLVIPNTFSIAIIVGIGGYLLITDTAGSSSITGGGPNGQWGME